MPKAATAQVEALVRCLLVPVREDWYALELRLVREVLRGPSLTRVPGAPRALLGVLNVRGEVVSVLDTGVLLGLPAVAGAAAVVVADSERGAVGLSASGLPVAADLGEELRPSELPGGVAVHEAPGSRVATLLDLGALCGPERVAG